MIVLENEHFIATIKKHGAELISLVSKKYKIEYIWHGDAKFWGRHTPVLFPIVGRLKNNEYRYQGKTYHMKQHGFARDSEFTVLEQTKTEVALQLTESAKTLEQYPFVFRLILTFVLSDKGIFTKWKVKNPSQTDAFYFGIGGHPAFNVPLEKGLSFNDYFLYIKPYGRYERIPFIAPYLDVEHTQEELLRQIPLKHILFENDALVYKIPGKVVICLRTDKSERSLALHYTNIPYVGLWSPYPKESPFICIEPWFSIADTIDSTGELTEKLGMQKLTPGQLFESAYFIEAK